MLEERGDACGNTGPLVRAAGLQAKPEGVRGDAQGWDAFGGMALTEDAEGKLAQEGLVEEERLTQAYPPTQPAPSILSSLHTAHMREVH